jgi:selenide,water dikinase
LLTRCRTPEGPRTIATVGGGAAGFELILAVRHRLLSEAASARSPPFSFALVTSGRLLEDQNRRIQGAARRELERQNVRLIEGTRVLAIDGTGLTLSDGWRLEAEAVLVSTAAAAPGWLADTGLSKDPNGFLATRRTLQSLNDLDVFAVGDCATMIDDPRPKAGVFAVRQGPVLAQNIRRHVQGRPLALHYPQDHWLSMLTAGGRYAMAGRGIYKVEGRWVWHWKDWIDRRWVRRYAA